MTSDERVNEKLQEAWEHFKSHFNSEESKCELRQMRECCEAWYGAEYNYSDCRNKQCFRFWLAYLYLNWEESYN